MLSENIILQSAGSLSVAVMALLMLILQTLFFFRKPQSTWYAWSAAISFSALLYSVGIFLEYNTPEGPLNRFSGLLEYTAIICLIHCLYGFTFSYLGIESKRYHPVAGVCHGLILILLWSTNYVVAESFITRDFIGLESPYIEPALGPLGPVFVLYAAIAGVNAMIVWIKHKRTDSKHRIAFLAGMGFWLLLGIHDGLASLGLPTLQYFMEYGFLSFAMAVLWVVFRNYLEIEAEEKYRVITEFANDCILVIQDGKMVFRNPACCDLIGGPLTDSATRDFLDIMALEDRKTVLKDYNTLLEGGHAPNPHTVRIRGADGEQRFVEIASSLIQYRNRPAVLAIMRDMTERKRAEGKLMNTLQKLQETRDMLVQSEKLAAIGRLTTGITHEILNPINIISMRMQLVNKTADLSDRTREALGICKSQLNRIAEITKELGQFARIPKKDIIMSDLNKVIGHVLTLYEPQFKVDDINTDIQFHPNLPLIPLDKDRIEQVIFNIISNANASMAAQKNKMLRIITKPTASKDYVQAIISDTGTGIDSSDMNKIFDPFFTTKDQPQGTGLGLFISYNIIQDHGGRIWAENNEWGGASFFIELPVVRDINR